MGARTKARKRALDIVFESELRGLGVGETLGDRQATADPALNPYTVTLVEGVISHQAAIDELISTYSCGWSLERMPAVDRTVLRLGVFEMMYGDEVPAAVAISEAVSLVKMLSTDESPAFVNGVLSRISRVVVDEPGESGDSE